MTSSAADRRAVAARVQGVYLITPDVEGDNFDRVLATVDIALAAGVGVVQYRSKHAAPATRRAQAAELVALARSRAALCIINDQPDLAIETAADGAHLGRDDGDPTAARTALASRLLGVSCYGDPARAQAAAAAGADMLAFGSMFRSLTKPGALYAPLALLTAARSSHPACRIVAIGGITAQNIAAVAAAGAHAAAVIQAVFGADDPRAAVLELQQQFSIGRARHESQRTAV